uniref:Uncharacterized protein n=1 Tax=Solanum tuberosum TaxID=4113 RepID=M1B2V7_SOLTU
MWPLQPFFGSLETPSKLSLPIQPYRADMILQFTCTCSPEDHCQPSSAPHKFDQLPAPQPILVPKTDSGELKDKAVTDSKPQEASDAIENINILHLSLI